MSDNHLKYHLYEVNKNVRCIKCGCKGAIQSYGIWNSNGIGDKADIFKFMEKYRDNPHMSYTGGFGGTIPWECMNCGNVGLIDFGGLEGYDKAFETIK